MKSILRHWGIFLAVTALILASCGSSSESSSDNGGSGNGGSDTGSSECEPEHEFSTIEEGYLTVAAYTYPPFSIVDDGNKLTGAEGEILTRIAEKECLEIKVVEGDAAAMIPSIENGRADTTLGSWYRTEEREKVIALGTPVIVDRLTLVTAQDVETIEDLEGKKVGSVLGFLWNEELKDFLGQDVSEYDSGQAMYADLAAGRIDVIVDTYPSAQSVLENTPIDDLNFVVPPPSDLVESTKKPGQTNFPVSKDNKELLVALDDGVVALRESGELEEIVLEYGFTADAAEPGEPNKL